MHRQIRCNTIRASKNSPLAAVRYIPVEHVVYISFAASSCLLLPASSFAVLMPLHAILTAFDTSTSSTHTSVKRQSQWNALYTSFISSESPPVFFFRRPLQNRPAAITAINRLLCEYRYPVLSTFLLQMPIHTRKFCTQFCQSPSAGTQCAIRSQTCARLPSQQASGTAGILTLFHP